MRVFGVIDLRRGSAVHARGGRREAYRPLEVSAGTVVGGDPLVLARAYVDRCGVSDLYVADLDAIGGGAAAQRDVIAALASVGVPLWLDAGVASRQLATRARDLGAARVIVGLETLSSFDVLADICQVLGTERVAFSLDLRDGAPVTHPASALQDDSPDTLVRRAARAGAGAIVAIDLARIGSGAGVDIELMERIRHAAPALTLVAGGGVRTPQDIARLGAAGCDGVLLATALHTGSVTAGDLARLVRHATGQDGFAAAG